jgi:hypothetical protein
MEDDSSLLDDDTPSSRSSAYDEREEVRYARACACAGACA